MLADDVAALYVDRNGPYPGRVADWYDEKRDARSYAAELPVVAHPPCQRWCRLAGLVEARWGHKRGDDGGLFEHALETVRRVGGVLEHPAYSDAWAAYGLPRPPTGEGWVPGALAYEWTCYVEQWRYGHRAKKATWLYYRGFRKPFALRWGYLRDSAAAALGCAPWRDSSRRPRLALASFCANRLNGHRANKGTPTRRPRLTKKEAVATPPEFLETLIELARWAA